MLTPRLVLFFAGVLCVVHHGASSLDCPNQKSILPCRCSQRGDEIQIWCSHSELPHVIKGLKSVSNAITRPIDELILENNNLPSLPGRAFQTLRIMRLMLRNNGLQRVSSGWLSGLEDTLLELYIVENDLRSLPMDILDKLRKIEAVTLQTNSLKRLPSFSGLPRLKYINIQSESLIELIPAYFKQLPLLETIHIFGSNRLNRLESGLFDNLPLLTLINISNCGVNWIHMRALSRLVNLKEISLNGNRISDAGMVGRALRELPELSIIKLNGNQLSKLNEASFVDLPMLKELYLSNNKVKEIMYGAFHRVPMLKILDLNHNLVEKIHPESFLQRSGSGVEELWLVDNDISHISELRSLLDALPRLKFLDMSYNKLEEIPFEALRGHPTLETLLLDHNRIQFVEREAFMAMPSLRELRLKNNSLSNLLNGPLWNLPSLKGLDLSFNFYRKIDPKLLTNLPSLRKLDFSGNSLNYIDPAAFIDNAELEHINISFNILSAIHPNTFRHLTKLYELEINNNQLNEFVPGLPRNVENLFLATNRISSLNRNLDLPDLKIMDVSHNLLQNLEVGALRTLPQLRKLNIGRNLLKHVDFGVFDGLNRLEVLNLENNQLVSINEYSFRNLNELKTLILKENDLEILGGDLLQDLVGLRALDISGNKIFDIYPQFFERCRDIVEIDASNNLLQKLPEALLGLTKLEKLNLMSNRLKNLPPEVLRTLVALVELNLSDNRIQELKQGAFQNLVNLKILDLSSNLIDNLEIGSVRSLPVLSWLRLDHNKLTDIRENTFLNLHNLQSVDLQRNNINSISNKAFVNVPTLLMLNLSHNDISNLEFAGLKSFRSLEVLDLSSNKILKVQTSNLENMEWLVELKLDNNRICAVQGSPFSEMPRLRVLSLRNNRLTNLAEPAVHTLRSNIAVLDIDGNPLSCSCGLLWLRAWLQEASWEGPHCADGSMFRESRLSREECQYEQRRIEPIIPGCESEILDTHTIAQTHTWFDRIKLQPTPIDGSNNLERPNPEESEYFDEYVDFPFNDSSLFINKNKSSFVNDKVVVLTTATPVLSSHVIPGDTPAFYAGNLNKTQIKKQNSTLSKPAASSSSFTFFGVPIPSLNIGKFWGSGRNVDRKIDPTGTEDNDSIGTVSVTQNTRGNGRVQSFPITKPEIQNGGFRPMVIGSSGGFVPINPKYSDIEVSKNENTSWPTDFPSSKFLPKRQDEIPDVTEAPVIRTTTEEIPVTDMSIILEDVDLNKIPDNTPEEVVQTTTTSAPEVITTEATTTTTTAATTTTTELILAEVQTTTQDSVARPVNSNTPSSLTDILAPGGEHQSFRTPGARLGTITKVISPEPPYLPTAEEYLRTQNPFDIEVDDTLKSSGHNDSMNWYFDNYNESRGSSNFVDSVPLLEPGVNRFRSSSCERKSYSVYMTAVALLFVVFNEA